MGRGADDNGGRARADEDELILRRLKVGRYMVASGAFGAGETVIQTGREVWQARECLDDGQISGDERGRQLEMGER